MQTDTAESNSTPMSAPLQLHHCPARKCLLMPCPPTAAGPLERLMLPASVGGCPVDIPRYSSRSPLGLIGWLGQVQLTHGSRRKKNNNNIHSSCGLHSTGKMEQPTGPFKLTVRLRADVRSLHVRVFRGVIIVIIQTSSKFCTASPKPFFTFLSISPP